MISYYAGDDLPVFLITVFSKGDRADLTARARRIEEGACWPCQRLSERATAMGKAADEKILKNVRATRAAIRAGGIDAVRIHVPDHVDVRALRRQLGMSQAAIALASASSGAQCKIGSGSASAGGASAGPTPGDSSRAGRCAARLRACGLSSPASTASSRISFGWLIILPKVRDERDGRRDETKFVFRPPGPGGQGRNGTNTPKGVSSFVPSVLPDISLVSRQEQITVEALDVTCREHGCERLTKLAGEPVGVQVWLA